MASNSFGKIFRITTWGESHGKAIGVVVDGCPANLSLTVEDIQKELDKRKPGLSPYTSPRKEPDRCEILSGVFNDKTTGAPISIIIWNRDVNSSPYEKTKDIYRVGHADFTYEAKYQNYDYRGGGRASARETACRVAAAAIAKKLLATKGIVIEAKLVEVGGKKDHFEKVLQKAIDEGDSVGGVVEAVAYHIPKGLGEPVYHKLEAMLSYAMLSIPASKGFEIGEGFLSAKKRGSEHNDSFCYKDGNIFPKTNRSGGVLAGISTGNPLVIRVPFKPTSSINKPQMTVDKKGNKMTYSLEKGSRHDPCVAIRAVPVVSSMMALVLADFILLSKTSSLA